MPNRAGRPSKPLSLVKGHRTKKEKAVRAKAEVNLQSGYVLKEWETVKNNIIAHGEFIRIQKIFKAVQKNDSLYENSINRYCLLHAECYEYETAKNDITADIKELIGMYTNKVIDFVEYINEKNKLRSALYACDKKIMDKRKMMLDLEKENALTIRSALNAIPKKEQKESDIDPMAALLGGE